MSFVNAQDKANGYVSLSVPAGPPMAARWTVEAVILDPAGNSTLPGQDSAQDRHQQAAGPRRFHR